MVTMILSVIVAADAADVPGLLESMNLPAVGGLGFGAFGLAFLLYRNLRTAQIELTDKYIAENTVLRTRIEELEGEARAADTARREALRAALDTEREAHRVQLRLESEIAALQRRLDL